MTDQISVSFWGEIQIMPISVTIYFIKITSKNLSQEQMPWLSASWCKYKGNDGFVPSDKNYLHIFRLDCTTHLRDFNSKNIIRGGESHMRRKYNSSFSVFGMNTDRHGSYIQKYLEQEVNYLLASSVDQLNQVDFEKVYIHHADMEDALSKYLVHTHSNSTCVITGLTGSGKTMLVRHVFGLRGIKPRIEGTSIIIPFNFDNALYTSVKTLFTRMVRAACDCLLEKFPALNHIDNHSEEFFQFIKERRNDLLYGDESYPTPSHEAQLQALCKENAFAFHICAFKFYLNQSEV